MATEQKIHVIIVAAGIGSRFSNSSGPPKQYHAIGQQSVLAHSIAAFDKITVDDITVVINKDDIYWNQIEATSVHPLNSTQGGLQRHDSVRNGIRSLRADPSDWVLVHDAARPCVTATEIETLITTCINAQQGGLLVQPVTDTIKLSQSGQQVDKTVNREQLFAALTPQMFRCGDLLKALTVFEADSITDESSAIEAQGQKPLMIKGSRTNIKITEFSDLAMAQRILEQQGRALMRIGSGFDVHAFGPGEFITLGNVRIPHQFGFVAHSDGDVLIHAICDALLGACALGDIGQYFPPSDPQWAGCDSVVFLKHCHQLILKQGYQIGNLDCTIIAEQPKIRPHVNTIQKRLADILQTKPNQIGIKATTTEQLGFTGRKEGVAVQATCLLLKQ